MTNNELKTVARLLRVALGYESREVRIGEMLASPYLDVRMLAQRLRDEGFMTESSVSEVLMLASYTPPRGR